MKIIGLTGGIAAGKNFVAEIFKQNGAAIFDADKEVHNLLESDGSIIHQVKKYFPHSFVEKKIDRKILGKIVFDDVKKLEILERILHPQVRKKYEEFLLDAKKQNKKLVVLNIPLLLEKQGYKCDKVVAVIAAKSVQRKRFLARAKKSDNKNFLRNKSFLEEKFAKIHARQMSNSARKDMADFVVDSGLSKLNTISQVQKIFAAIS